MTFESAAKQLLEPAENEEKFSPTTNLDTNKAIAIILSTSGTTGNPKPVAISHAHLIAHCFSWYPMPSNSVVLTNSAFSWITVFEMNLPATIKCATRVISSKFLEVEDYVRTVQMYNVSYTFATPDHITKLVKYLEVHKMSLNSMKIMRTGGWLLMQETRETLQKLIPNGIALEGYGMTETMWLAVNWQQKKGSAGKLLPNTTVKVVTEDGNHLGPNEPGEICAKFQVPILGYVDKEVNKKLFDDEDFFHTGDIGYVDTEGFVFIKGRMNDYIGYLGVSYNTTSVEHFITRETGIGEVCVMPLEDQGEGGEPPAAAIVKPASCQLTEDDIYKLTLEKLPPHQHLDGGVYFVKELPRSKTSGKILRYEVKRLLMALSKSK